MVPFPTRVLVASAMAALSLLLAGCQKTEILDEDGRPGSIEEIMESTHDPVVVAGAVEPTRHISANSVVSRLLLNPRGDTLRFEKWSSKGVLLHTKSFAYNQKHNLVTSHVLNLKTIVRKETSKFDEQDRLLERLIFDERGQNVARYVGHFDSSGNALIDVYKFWEDKPLRISQSLYNSHGEILERLKYSNETLTYRELNQYDDRHQLVQRIRSYPQKGEQLRTLYKHDTENRMSKTLTIGTNLLIQSGTVSTYDDHLNTLTEIVYRQSGQIQEQRRYTYDYDDRGNWTRCISFVNGRPTRVTVRRIKYY